MVLDTFTRNLCKNADTVTKTIHGCLILLNVRIALCCFEKDKIGLLHFSPVSLLKVVAKTERSSHPLLSTHKGLMKLAHSPNWVSHKNLDW